MRRKPTNEDVKEVLSEVAEQIRSDLDFEFRVAQSRMGIAENDLCRTFNEEQKALYKEFCKERKAFYKIASEIFERKILPVER